MTLEEAEAFVETTPTGRQRKQPDINTKTSMIVQVPIGLKVALEKHCKDSIPQVGVSAFARNLLADAIGYELPTEAGRPVRTKMSDDEKKAAARARGQEQRNMIRLMLERVRAEEGLVEDEEDELDEDEDEDEE